MGNLFDLDDNLLKEEKKDYKDLLKKANIFCMRELYDKALDIYNSILEEDMENEDAYIGILKVHSQYFTKYDGDEIEKDIRIIERMFPDTVNEEYAEYCLKRQKALKDKASAKKEVVDEKVEEPKKEEKKAEPKKEEKKVEIKEEKKPAPTPKITKYPEIEKAFHQLDIGYYKKPKSMMEGFLKSHNDIYAHFALGLANYYSASYVKARKPLETFFNAIDKNNPFYYRCAYCLGYAYSGKDTNNVPVLDKALHYLKLAYEVKPCLRISALIEMIKDASSEPRKITYVTNGALKWYANHDKTMEFANYLINKKDILGYCILGIYGDQEKSIKVNHLNTYLNSPKANKNSYFYINGLKWRDFYLGKKDDPDIWKEYVNSYSVNKLEDTYKKL